MPDYNIYIHAVESSSGTGSQTKPWSTTNESQGQDQTQPWGKAELGQIKSGLMSPMGAAGGAISQAARYVPAIAASYAAVKIGSKLFELQNTYETITSGDYRLANKMHDFKAALSFCSSPISSIINIMLEKVKIKVENEKRTMERELLGDSVINSLYGRGV